MTLDCVEISLGRVFASGQAYVALSRARSLQGLRVLDFDPMVVRCDPRVLRFYATLRRGSSLGLVRESHPVLGQGTLGRGDRAFSGSTGDRGKRKEMLTPRLWPWRTAEAHDVDSLASIQESPLDEAAASDQENMDPNL